MQPPIDLPSPYEPHAAFITAFTACPLIAILRGVTPADAADQARALYAAGFRIVEVPLNSPQPFASIAAIREALPPDAMVGAGTVLHPDHVGKVKRSGGELIVMPHSDAQIVCAAKAQGLACAPGVATPSEAFAALKSGADALKMFPAEQLGAQAVKAWRAVIAAQVPLVPVGGITPSNMGPFVAAGASGFGLGSALYQPGQGVATTAANASAFINGLNAVKRGANP
jgi:2-dehydro-3-deoxyphosphogalactonate aldolase